MIEDGVEVQKSESIASIAMQGMESGTPELAFEKIEEQLTDRGWTVQTVDKESGQNSGSFDLQNKTIYIRGMNVSGHKRLYTLAHEAQVALLVEEAKLLSDGDQVEVIDSKIDAINDSDIALAKMLPDEAEAKAIADYRELIKIRLNNSTSRSRMINELLEHR